MLSFIPDDAAVGATWNGSGGAFDIGRQPPVRTVRGLSSTQCAGVDGRAIPNLAGQNRRYLAKQMALFRAGARIDPAMQVVAAHPTLDNPPDVMALMNYLSRLDWNPRLVKGSGAHLGEGQETYMHICAACHGIDGRGEAGIRVPRIAGQQYPYLRLEIDVAAALHRDLAPPEMTSALRSMPSKEKDALADYISRLGHSEALPDSRPYEERKQ